MRTFLETSTNFTNAENSMKSYVDFVLVTCSEVLSLCRKLSYTFTSSLHTLRTYPKQVDTNGEDIRTEPKFNLPDGDLFTDPWCRPQNDGPGLTLT